MTTNAAGSLSAAVEEQQDEEEKEDRASSNTADTTSDSIEVQEHLSPGHNNDIKGTSKRKSTLHTEHGLAALLKMLPAEIRET